MLSYVDNSITNLSYVALVVTYHML